MKNLIIPVLFITNFAFAQMGVNTSDPKTTFDISALNPTGNAKNADGLLIPRVDRERAQSMINIETSTMIYVNNAASGSQTGKAINIDTAGYYYYNGTEWTKLNKSSNIYNIDGTLTENRTINQNDKTLAFTANSVNAFSVDGTTLSVNAADNMVGIGTADPETKFDVLTKPGDGKGYGLQHTNGTVKLRTYVGIRENNGTAESALIGTFTNHSFDLMTNDAPRVRIDETGKVGIGTPTPQKKLHVNGDVQVTGELNVGGNATTVGSAGTVGQVLTSNGAGEAPIWKEVSISGITKSSIYYLQNNITNFLDGMGIGTSQVIPVTNSIDGADGVTFNSATSTFNFSKAGYYKISVTYQADHNATGCTLSSYFSDFPAYDGSNVRIYTTAAHNQGTASNHSGTIVYAGELPANSNWIVKLGRGDSGNCSGSGMTLKGKSTIIEITSISH